MAPTLLDALACAPAAAALVVAALERADDRKALRLAHPQLRDAVGEATTKLTADFEAALDARPLTARRWPRLARLKIHCPHAVDVEALGAETWGALRALALRALALSFPVDQAGVFGAPAACALVAALRRMPALRALELWSVALPDAAAAADLFRASSAEAVPLRSLRVYNASLTPAAERALAASGWRLERLQLGENLALGAAGVAALLASPRRSSPRRPLPSAASTWRVAAWTRPPSSRWPTRPGRSRSWTSRSTSSAPPRPGPRWPRSRGTAACAAWTWATAS